jgi:hypothetical protein
MHYDTMLKAVRGVHSVAPDALSEALLARSEAGGDGAIEALAAGISISTGDWAAMSDRRVLL